MKLQVFFIVEINLNVIYLRIDCDFTARNDKVLFFLQLG
jgi:hypothetical protein